MDRIKSRHRRFGVGACLLCAAVSVTMVAGTAKRASGQNIRSYAAKFVCGPLTADADVVKGTYATAINIHNPQSFTVTFTKKAVIALSESILPRGLISAIKSEFLLPDEAVYVDCKEIKNGFFGGLVLPNHIEGFVVIQVLPGPTGLVPDELDVVAKYTARPNGGQVSSIDVEEIQSKLVK